MCRHFSGNIGWDIGWERGGHIGRYASRSRCDIYGRVKGWER